LERERVDIAVGQPLLLHVLSSELCGGDRAPGTPRVPRTRMNIDGRRVDKGTTEQRIIAALPPGFRLVRINWKKGGKIHVVDGFGRKKIISLRSAGA
jgi:hypothetical protein